MNGKSSYVHKGKVQLFIIWVREIHNVPGHEQNNSKLGKFFPPVSTMWIDPIWLSLSLIRNPIQRNFLLGGEGSFGEEIISLFTRLCQTKLLDVSALIWQFKKAF